MSAENPLDPNQAPPAASSATAPAAAPDAPASANPQARPEPPASATPAATFATRSSPLFAPALAGLEAAINGYLTLDPEGAARLAPLAGRIIACEFTGFGQRLYFIPGVQGFQLFGDYAAEPDCLIRGSPLGLAGLGLGKRPEEALFSGQVEVVGDSALAQRFGDCLASIRIDWEEQLSRLTGDPLAHALGNQVRAAGRWGQRALDHLGLDLQEYLKEEGRLLPTRYEVEGFLDAVDRLRDDGERLAARVERLWRRQTEHPGQANQPGTAPHRRPAAGPGGSEPQVERAATPQTPAGGESPSC